MCFYNEWLLHKHEAWKIHFLCCSPQTAGEEKSDSLYKVSLLSVHMVCSFQTGCHPRSWQKGTGKHQPLLLKLNEVHCLEQFSAWMGLYVGLLMRAQECPPNFKGANVTLMWEKTKCIAQKVVEKVNVWKSLSVLSRTPGSIEIACCLFSSVFSRGARTAYTLAWWHFPLKQSNSLCSDRTISGGDDF